MNNQSKSSINLKIIIAVLTLLTAGTHFSLLFPDGLFILNGLGYLTLLAAYLVPVPFFRNNRGLIRWAFIGFTVVTIVAWIAIGDKSWPAGAMGYANKAIEVLLVIALLSDRSN